MRKILLFTIAILLLAGCGQVEQGERATFSRWGKMEQVTYGPGLYFYEPFGTNMDTHNVLVQRFDADKLGAATKDTQPVIVNLTVNYRVDDKQVHAIISTIGHGYAEKVLYPAVWDSLKAATARFHLADLIAKREEIRAIVKADLIERMAPQFIVVTDVNLTNIDVSKEFTHSVEAKQIAEQNVITATRVAESAKAEAKGKADAAREAALGAADATRAGAQALADSLRIEGAAKADYNRRVAESLTPALLQNRAIDAWRDGGAQVPRIVAGPGGLLLQVPMPKPAEK